MQIGITEDFLKSKQKWRSLLCERLTHTPEFSFYWKHKKCCQESTLLKILFLYYLAFVPSLRCSEELYRINLLSTFGIKIKITSKNFRCLLVIIIYYCGKINFKFRSIILPLQVKETLCVCVIIYTHTYTQHLVYWELSIFEGVHVKNIDFLVTVFQICCHNSLWFWTAII